MQNITIPIDPSISAEASSAHARVNIPLNLTVWHGRSADEIELLTWFHQHILDERLTWDEATAALGYDRTTLFRILKGSYQAESWAKPIANIRSYKRIALQRATIHKNIFTENSVSRLIWAGLDYAIANNSITTIIGESRSGKTIAARAWAAANNHGRSVFITAPPVGGIKALMRAIADRIGANKNLSIVQLAEALQRGFNQHRILIVDEAHRLMPSDSRTVNPAHLELLRDLHDQTECALALIATARFDTRLRSGSYQFEQLIGRIGMPIRIPKSLTKADVLPLIRQYVSTPSEALTSQLLHIANAPGRLGILAETLKVASRIAAKAKQPLDETHIHKAIQLRTRMSSHA